MSPVARLNQYQDHVCDAREFAELSQFARGYSLLLGGLRRSREEAEQDPHAAQMVRRYLRALDEYCRRYGVAAD